jgi:hypothetical protein
MGMERLVERRMARLKGRLELEIFGIGVYRVYVDKTRNK